MPLIHGERQPDLTAPEYVVLPEGMTKDEGERLVAAASRLDEFARDMAKAGA